MTLSQKNIYRRTDAGTVGWNDELDTVFLQWHGFASSETFRAHMRHCIELLEAAGANRLFADARDQGAINDEDKRWSVTEWARQADEAGLDYLVVVYPESVIAKMSVDSVMEQTEDDIERCITDDIEEGQNWLAEKPATATDVSISELEGLTLDEEPDTDADGERDRADQAADGTPTESDSNHETSADAAMSVPEREEDSTTASSATADSAMASTGSAAAETGTSSSTGKPLDPLTIGAVGGIIAILGLGGVTFVTKQVPELVSNGTINGIVVISGVALLGIVLGWGSAKAVA